MKPILLTSGDPAGIGPDLCVSLPLPAVPVVMLGDRALLEARAAQLGVSWRALDYKPGRLLKAGTYVWSIPTAVPGVAGQLDTRNSAYVMRLLTLAAEACLRDEFSALVTAPVHKGIINEAGISFSGHTEYFAQVSGVKDVVMMLLSDAMKVALVTTHLPLAQVPAAITQSRLERVIQQVLSSMREWFNLAQPRVWVAGLNPHAGEGGHLGREEIDIIAPVIHAFQQLGECVRGPFSADTLFTPACLSQADVVISMYHDQGLPVLKYASFGAGVNMTLGLPFIRTSVDHGTALTLAGTGQANAGSLQAALQWAQRLGRS